MGCNCKEIKGFDKAIIDGSAFERNTKKQAAIISIGGIASFTDLANVKKIKDICCYYTTDRVEHKIVRPKKRKTTKKQD